MNSLKDQFPEEFLICEKALSLHPKIRAKELSRIENSDAFNYLSDFDTNNQKAKALVANLRVWPACPACGAKVAFFNDFAKSCSKKCAGVLSTIKRSAVQANKNEEKIAALLKNLSDKGISPLDRPPTLITERIDWVHDDHVFNRALFAGGWLIGCVTCGRREQAKKASVKRWTDWKVKNDSPWTHSEESKHRMRSTVFERYGYENVSQIPTVKDKIAARFRTNYVENVVPLLLKNIEENFDVVPVGKHNYVDSGAKHMWRHRSCGRVFEHYLNYAGPTSCPDCRPKSRPEDSLFEFVSSHVHAERGHRDLLKPSKKEIDIWVPSKSLGIEMNGVYWHSGDRPSGSLLDKSKLASSANIQLMHVWDYEWIMKRAIVENIILSKLGKNSKIFARKCVITEIDARTASIFLEQNHIHGKSNRLTHNFALKFEGEIVFVMSFGRPRFSRKADWEIVRSCAIVGSNILGGLSKCIAAFRAKYSGSILTYADLRFFDGHSYAKLGFTHVANRSPNYQYVKGTKVLSRLECQKHKLPRVLGEKFQPHLTEEQNMISDNWLKISDCGVSTWILE